VRILAIRGCNLASLAGEFEIDLAHGALGGAGVFAIVGNTGAGKSTVLDALCVALFDRTPRLTNHSTVKVGRGDERALLGAQDVRTLLRRGAAQGWAEVDFESGDARQYRARWSVRRARGQSDGTLQDEQLSLTAIDGGERLGGTKTETLKAIHARLGLSFDQFRRSALLAQGEFAAFLRADGKDRSELLERMTGTQIYSRLSIAAHVKAALAEQRLRDGRAAAQAIAVLDDDAERAVRAELAAATEAALAARKRHAAAEQAARWIAEATRRERELAAAAAEHAAARAALVSAEADRAELVLRRRAELLRPSWDDAGRLERSAAVAAAEVASAGDAAARAARELAAIGERRAQVAAMQTPVRAARIAAGIVERAAAADRLDSVARTAADDAAWLAARSALGPEIAAWPELEARFAQHDALGETIAALDRALGEHAESRAKLDRAHKVVAGEVKAQTGLHEDAKRKAASYSQKRGLTLDAARRLEDQARTRLADIERLVEIAARARAAVDERDDLDRQLAELAAAIAADAAQRARLSEAQHVAGAVRAEQARVVEELRRAAGYEHARAELVDGEPCPLCGSAEHPWRDRGALDDVIAGAADRLAATVAQLDEIATQSAAIAARDAHHARERARLARLRTAAVATASTAIATWRDHLSALGELLLVEDPATPAAEALAADRLALARKALEDARATRSQTEAATKAAQDAQAEVQLSQAALDQLATKLAELERRRGDLEATIGQLRGERASKQDHHASLASELAAAMARWMSALPAESEANTPRDAVRRAAGRTSGGHGGDSKADIARKAGRGSEVAGDAKDPGGAIDPRAGTDRSGADAIGRGAGVGGSAGVATGANAANVAWGAGRASGAGRAGGAGTASGAVTASGAIDPTLALALVARLQASAPPTRARGPLPSSPLAIVRFAIGAVVAAWRDHADRVAHADATLSAAAAAIERDAREIDRALAEHTARRDDAGRRRDELGRELAGAVARLDLARGKAGFAPDELRRLLSADPSRVDALAERLAALDRTLERTRAVVTERERQVAEHAATRPVLELFDAPRRPSTTYTTAGVVTQGSARAAANANATRPTVTIASASAVGAPDASMGAETTMSGGTAMGGEAAAQVDALGDAVAAAERRAAQLAERLTVDAEARLRRTAALASVAADEASAEVDRILGDVIGSHDGKLFRSFAQSLTLDSLLAVANAHLEELAPRYQLERVPRHDLELQVIDRDLGSEVRSVQSLSGGESFLVSLALALGLSSMSAHDVRVRTLLIDEGFGTLDPATLDSALSVLDALQATGRQVGVISHVPALVERVGAHVRVVQRGGGRSEVIVA
jgi:exonuclease SbcC